MIDSHPDGKDRRWRPKGPTLIAALVLILLSACAAPGTAQTIPPARVGVATASAAASPAASTKAPARRAPATAPVPPPVAGNIHQKVAEAPRPVATSAPMTSAVVAGGVRIEILDRKLFNFTSGGGVGDLSGPAITVSLRITNDGLAPLDVSNVSVTVQDAAGSPASQLLGTKAVPFAGSLRARGSAIGAYSFSLPRPSRAPLQIQVSYSATSPAAVFVGGV